MTSDLKNQAYSKFISILNVKVLHVNVSRCYIFTAHKKWKLLQINQLALGSKVLTLVQLHTQKNWNCFYLLSSYDINRYWMHNTECIKLNHIKVHLLIQWNVSVNFVTLSILIVRIINYIKNNTFNVRFCIASL